MLVNGKIIKINSDLFTVDLSSETIDCKLRGKIKYNKIQPLVGDTVKVNIITKTIESIEGRKNNLLRPPVANIDKALIVTSIVEPNISLSLLDKLISIVIINKIEPVIVFTKLDKVKNLDEINILKEYYESIGIKVFYNTEIVKLKEYLKDNIITVVGQTGSGKSTLINKLSSNLKLNTHEISKALGRGVHTTRIVELFKVDNFYIIDTPGFSSIDINNYSKEEIKNSFIEFNKYDCKFKDCNHEKEIGCKVIEKVNTGIILKSRYDNYLRFIKE